VENLSSQTLRYVEIHVIWVDANGTPQSDDWTFVDYTTLLPGQQSPWNTIDPYNPALTRYRIQMVIDGALLPYNDLRPR
jgi:hypothetical protein